MNDLNDMKRYSTAIHEHILQGKGGIQLIEALINASGLFKDLLHLGSFDSIRFYIDPGHIVPLSPPEIEGLTLVVPETFEFNWRLSVSGYFMVKYKAVSRPLPHHVNPFHIRYSGILISMNKDLKFRNEQVKLI
jgi:hypothetical protein